MVRPWKKEKGDIGQLKNMSLGCRKRAKKGRVRVASRNTVAQRSAEGNGQKGSLPSSLAS